MPRPDLFSEADLAFTPNEVAQLLARHGVRPGDAVPQLLADTNGWATGVHLSIGRVASTDLERLPRDRRELIHEFLVQEVLDPMDGADRDFLRRCSILTTLSPAICAQVTGTTRAGRRLAALSKSNVLITLVDPSSQTYRLHQLLRETLERDLRETDPEALDRVHALAAAWFVDHDRPIEAVEHALRVSTPALAADTIAGCWSGLDSPSSSARPLPSRPGMNGLVTVLQPLTTAPKVAVAPRRVADLASEADTADAH